MLMMMMVLMMGDIIAKLMINLSSGGCFCFLKIKDATKRLQQ